MPYVSVQYVEFDTHSIELLIGDSEQINAHVYPDNATDQKLEWISKFHQEVYLDTRANF